MISDSFNVEFVIAANISQIPAAPAGMSINLFVYDLKTGSKSDPKEVKIKFA